jgi:hypothetical protein
MISLLFRVIPKEVKRLWHFRCLHRCLSEHVGLGELKFIQRKNNLAELLALRNGCFYRLGNMNLHLNL